MKKLLPLFLAAAAVLTHSAFGQTATTTPVGAMTYSFPATTQLTGSYISIPLTSPPVYSGVVQSLTATTLTFSGTPFTEGGFSQAGAPYFLRFQTGAQTGRTILVTANTSNTVTLDVTDNSSQTTNLNTSGFAVAPGDAVQVMPGDTLASFFGDNTIENPLVLVGAAGALAADTVSIYSKTTGRFESYFFSTSLQRWRSTTASTLSKNDTVIYPESSIGIGRRSGRPPLAITVTGDVPTVAGKSKTVGGTQGIYTSSRFPVDMTLSQLNLTNWTKSNSALSADTLSIYNTTSGKWDGYYQKLDGSWRKIGNAVVDESGFVIPAGISIGLLKRGSVSGSTSYISASIPYSL